MKNSLIFIFLLAAANTCFAEDFLDSVAKKTCTCLDNVPAANLNQDNAKAQMGVCIIGATTPQDREQFKKDYALDFNQLDKNGTRIGEIIGVRVLTTCPASIQRVMSVDNKNTVGTVTGVITKIEQDFPVVFSLKDNQGKVIKLYWVDPVESEQDLPNTYSNLIGKTVEVKYKNKDMFDPKIGEYRQFKVISKIK
jgi:hypothetical protein